MKVSLQNILQKYGNQIAGVCGGVTVAFRGFLQHSGSKSQRNMKREVGPLGEIPGGQYVLLAPMEPELSVGDVLTEGNLQVVIRRLETVRVKDKPVYRWGLCEEKGGEDAWGTPL